MLTANTAFETELKKRIDEEIERIRDILTEGTAIKDYSDYRFFTGQIMALRRCADQYCDETAVTISKR
jgi:hypothetical protein